MITSKKKNHSGDSPRPDFKTCKGATKANTVDARSYFQVPRLQVCTVAEIVCRPNISPRSDPRGQTRAEQWKPGATDAQMRSLRVSKKSPLCLLARLWCCKRVISLWFQWPFSHPSVLSVGDSLFWMPLATELPSCRLSSALEGRDGPHGENACVRQALFKHLP